MFDLIVVVVVGQHLPSGIWNSMEINFFCFAWLFFLSFTAFFSFFLAMFLVLLLGAASSFSFSLLLFLVFFLFFLLPLLLLRLLVQFSFSLSSKVFCFHVVCLASYGINKQRRSYIR